MQSRALNTGKETSRGGHILPSFLAMTSEAARKKLERIALALRIDRSQSAEEMSPCDFCRLHRRRCIVDSSESTRCSECVRRKRSLCNYTTKLPSLGDWSSLDRQRQKLRDEEEEAMAKILRLRKQQRFLDDREKEMIRRGVETLDELDAAEAAEKADLARQEAAALSLAEASNFLDDPTLDPEAFASLPDSFWAGLGSPPSAGFSSVATGGWGLAGGQNATAVVAGGGENTAVYPRTAGPDPGS